MFPTFPDPDDSADASNDLLAITQQYFPCRLLSDVLDTSTFRNYNFNISLSIYYINYHKIVVWDPGIFNFSYFWRDLHFSTEL